MGSVISKAFFDRYSPVGDLVVIAVCLVMIILVLHSYITRKRSFRYFLSILGLLIVSAWCDVMYHALTWGEDLRLIPIIYAFRVVYHSALMIIFHLFAVYIAEVTNLEAEKRRKVLMISGSLATVMVVAETLSVLLGFGFHISETGEISRGINVFLLGYIAFCMVMVSLLASVRKLLYARVLHGFYWTVAVALVMQLLQRIFGQTSFTAATFLFPVIAMFYIMHSNPYNVTLGAVDSRAMEDMVKYNYEHKIDFLFLSLYLREFDEEGKRMPDSLKATIREFVAEYFHAASLFQISNGHIVLIVKKKSNQDYEKRTELILNDFWKAYDRFRYDYRVVIGESVEEISQKNEYASLIHNVVMGMKENTIHRMEETDIDTFRRREYVLRELEDICAKRDLEDPRVLAYCQPVYNIEAGRFDTAEALMRLRLPETGLVFPDQFIPLAEEHGLIHPLTEIILHKTCGQVKQLLDEGYQIERISVNVSALELKEEAFCQDINRVIGRHEIPGEKIAIELTESQSEDDFRIMKGKIEELHAEGIKFYLDDFGTGYSNMERIMELPFDIIKFDRSMVIASGNSSRSEKIVENLANIFREMDYSVLYEGVEDERDEQRCREMAASYLQGYKYSRPVPIEQLRDFLQKAS